MNITDKIHNKSIKIKYFYRYLNFLTNNFNELLDEIPLNIRNLLWFQQDGAPPHYGRNVRQWLNEMYPNRWIGRGGPIAWPARSPDITPLDFYLWGDIKTIVYEIQPETQDELRGKIVDTFNFIRENRNLNNVQRSIPNRINLCIRENGNHFEQFL